MSIQAIVSLEKIKEAIVAMKKHKLREQGRLNEEVSVSLRQDDLLAWNIAQGKLWLQFVNQGLVDMNNMNAFGQFGRWFYNYVLAHKDFPTMDNISGDEEFFLAPTDVTFEIDI